MGEVVDFQKVKFLKNQAVQDFPSLECPKCGYLCEPMKVDIHGSVHHRCASPDKTHRPFTWRINLQGEMLKGSKGNTEYRI